MKLIFIPTEGGWNLRNLWFVVFTIVSQGFQFKFIIIRYKQRTTKNNEIHAFAILSCPSMCHVFLICLWNYDHFALCRFHGCHLQFSIQTLDSWQDASVSISLSFSYSLYRALSLSTLLLVCVYDIIQMNSFEDEYILYSNFFTMQTCNSL